MYLRRRLIYGSLILGLGIAVAVFAQCRSCQTPGPAVVYPVVVQPVRPAYTTNYRAPRRSYTSYASQVASRPAVVQRVEYDEPVTQTTYRVEYETQYREETVTRRVPVWETEYRERRYTVSRQVPETSEREVVETVQRPVTETAYKTVVEENTRWVSETSEREERQLVQRPVTETSEREQIVTVRRPVEQTVMRTAYDTVYEPVTTAQTQLVTQNYGTYETQTVVKEPAIFKNRVVWRPERTGIDPRTGESIIQRAGLYREPRAKVESVQVFRPAVTPQTSYYTSYRPVTVEKQIAENITTYQDEQIVQKVPVQQTRMVTEEVVKKVPYTVSRPIVEKVEKQVPYTVNRVVEEQVVRKVPETRYRTVTEEKVETYPVQVCKWQEVTETRQVPYTVTKRVPVETVVAQRPSVCGAPKVCAPPKVCGAPTTASNVGTTSGLPGPLEAPIPADPANTSTQPAAPMAAGDPNAPTLPTNAGGLPPANGGFGGLPQPGNTVQKPEWNAAEDSAKDSATSGTNSTEQDVTKTYSAQKPIMSTKDAAPETTAVLAPIAESKDAEKDAANTVKKPADATATPLANPTTETPVAGTPTTETPMVNTPTANSATTETPTAKNSATETTSDSDSNAESKTPTLESAPPLGDTHTVLPAISSERFSA